MTAVAVGSVISILMYLFSFAALLLFVIAIVFYLKSDKKENRKTLFITSLILFVLSMVVWVVGSIVVSSMTNKLMYASVTEADVTRLTVTSVIFLVLRSLLNIGSIVVSILSIVKSKKYPAQVAAPVYGAPGQVPPVYQNGPAPGQVPPVYPGAQAYGAPAAYEQAQGFVDPNAAPPSPGFPAGE